ncbi:MAG: ribonuclease P protein component [Treponema sp.]|nr:ribonuclease P protein component [Treponema sp.]
MNQTGKDFRFRRKEHLKKGEDIRRAFKQGRVVSCPGAKLFVVQNEQPHNRIAFTFARKFGNAVERNRARRLSREVYRLIRDSLEPGFDLVLLLYPGGDFFAKRTEQLEILFRKAALLRAKNR